MSLAIYLRTSSYASNSSNMTRGSWIGWIRLALADAMRRTVPLDDDMQRELGANSISTSARRIA